MQTLCRALHCIEQGSVGDINDLGIEDGKAWIGPVEDDDDGTYEDTEDMAMQQSGRTLPQQRADELLYDDFSTLLGNQDLNDFASDTQPDNDTRHALVLLSLPVDHTWTDADLSNEHHLRIGLCSYSTSSKARSISQDPKMNAPRGHQPFLS